MIIIVVLLAGVLLMLMIAYHVYTIRTERDKYPHCIHVRKDGDGCNMLVHKNFLHNIYDYDNVCVASSDGKNEVCMGVSRIGCGTDRACLQA